jgi:hypothetical protein
LKGALLAVATVLLLPILAFFTYDALVFQPRQSAIQALLDQAPPEDRNPPALIRRYIQASHDSAISRNSYVARLLLLQFDDVRGKGTLRWHLSSALWAFLVSLHMSTDKVFALYSTLPYNGKDYGLSALSQRMYAKPLSALSETEAATVVAVLSGPSYYLREKGRLEQRRDTLLARDRDARATRDSP